MGRYLLTAMVTVLVTFSVLSGPMEKLTENSFHYPDEPVITAVDTITNVDVITQSVQTIIQKEQTKSLFPPTLSAHVLKGEPILFMHKNQRFFPRKVDGFICVVHYQSNYLPSLI